MNIIKDSNGHVLMTAQGGAFELPTTGGTYIVIQSITGATLTCGDQTYTLTGEETYHAFAVVAGTYTCTASKDGAAKSESVSVSSGVVVVMIVPPSVPDVYQEVTCLKSTGTQYINMGIPGSNQLGFEIKFEKVADTNQCVFGGRTAHDNLSFALTPFNRLGNANLGLFYFATSQTKYVYNVSVYGYGITTIRLDAQSKLLTGDNGSQQIADVQFECDYDLYLFGNNESNTFIEPFKSAIYYCKLLLNGTLLRYFIPCYRKSDNKPGMWDTVSQTFFVNQGTGADFLVGPDVN